MHSLFSSHCWKTFLFPLPFLPIYLNIGMPLATSEFQTPCVSTSQQPSSRCSSFSGGLKPDLFLQWEALSSPQSLPWAPYNWQVWEETLLVMTGTKIWLSTSVLSWSVFITLSVVFIRRHTGVLLFWVFFLPFSSVWLTCRSPSCYSLHSI